MPAISSRLKNRLFLIVLVSFLLISIFLFYATQTSKLLWSKTNSSEENKGIIVHIYDGDTFRISFGRSEFRLRLLGVNAAEIGDPREEVDLWARLARRFALYHLLRQQVKLTFERDKQDRYGRLLAYVWLKDNTLFNELILKHGLARYLETTSLSPAMKKRLQQAEEEARKAKRGIWQNQWPQAIKPDVASRYKGELKAIDFYCERVRVERGYTLIYARQSNFQVYISRDRRPFFSQLEMIKPGDFISVYGLIEDYRQQIQIILFYPQQLRVISQS